MAINYLNNLNKIVKINSAAITNASNKDALIINSRRNRDDLNNISSYINSIVYPAFSMLCSKPKYPYDVLESGISGMTIVTYPEEQGNNKFNTELFWKPGINNSNGRPCTIKESFDYIMANMVEKVVEITQSTVDLNDLWDAIKCNTLNSSKIAKDAFGSKYELNCNHNPFLEWSLARHIYEIFNQVISGHTNSSKDNLLLDPSDNYPTLSLANNVEPATTVIAGSVEIATIREIATLGRKENSTSGNHELVITPLNLYNSLDKENDTIENSADNLLREKVKEIALEKINESSITELNDVTANNPNNDQVLAWSSEENNWMPKTFSSNVESNIGTHNNSSNLTDIQYPESQIPYYDEEFNNVVSTALVWSKFLNTWTKRTPESINSITTTFKNLSGYRIPIKNNVNARATNISIYYKNIPYVFKAAPYKQLITNSKPDVVNYISRGKYQNRSNAFIFNENIAVIDNRNKYLCQNTCSRFDINENDQHGVVVDTLVPLTYKYEFKYQYQYEYASKDKLIGICRSDLDYEEPLSSFSTQSKVSYLNLIANTGALLQNSNFDEINSLILRSANNQNVDVALKQFLKVYLNSLNYESFLSLDNEAKNNLVKLFFLQLIKKETSNLTSNFHIFLKSQQPNIDLNTNIELDNVNLINSSEVPGLSLHNVSIQDSGFTKVMMLGPYMNGDSIYLCPGSILDTRGIEAGIGICISETFLNYNLVDLFMHFYHSKESTIQILDVTSLIEYLFPLPEAAGISLESIENLYLTTTLKELFFNHEDLGIFDPLIEMKFTEPLGTIVNCYNSMSYDELEGIDLFCEKLLETDSQLIKAKLNTVNYLHNNSYVEDYSDYLYYSLRFRGIDQAIESWLENNNTTANRLLFVTYYERRNELLKCLRSLSLVDIQIKL